MKGGLGGERIGDIIMMSVKPVVGWGNGVRAKRGFNTPMCAIELS